MVKTVQYHFYKDVVNAKVYKELLGNKYVIEIKEDNRTVSIHFWFDPNGNLIINNVYKNMTNYKSYRYIKKYAENKELMDMMMQFKID